MFEQATLTNGPASGARAWTTVLGLASQVALVSLAALTPMVFPQVHSPLRASWRLWRRRCRRPPDPKPLGNQVRQQPGHASAVRAAFTGLVVAPIQVPKGPIPVIEDAPAGPLIVGVPVGFSGPDTGVVSGILRGIGSTVPVVALPRVVPPAPKPVETAPIIRIPRRRPCDPRRAAP
ncbi:MAG: hypothetical protein WDO73_10445 [Ignavibacteriota bacterium]